MNIAIVYHSGYGHTQVVARHVAEGAHQPGVQVTLLTAAEARQQPDLLLAADTIVFGSPTYFGNVSAEFKLFMESTAGAWSRQLWKNKLAAGFTNSSTLNGDKLHTLVSLSLFAAQHSMLWIPLGILPHYQQGRQLAEPNGMGSYLGLMTLSDNAHDTFTEPADLHTAKLFGQRIAQVTQAVQGIPQQLALQLN